MLQPTSSSLVNVTEWVSEGGWGGREGRAGSVISLSRSQDSRQREVIGERHGIQPTLQTHAGCDLCFQV